MAMEIDSSLELLSLTAWRKGIKPKLDSRAPGGKNTSFSYQHSLNLFQSKFITQVYNRERTRTIYNGNAIPVPTKEVSVPEHRSCFPGFTCKFPAHPVAEEAEQKGADTCPMLHVENMGETAFSIPVANAIRCLVIFTGIKFFVLDGRVETVGPRLHDLHPSAEYLHLEWTTKKNGRRIF